MTYSTRDSLDDPPVTGSVAKMVAEGESGPDPAVCIAIFPTKVGFGSRAEVPRTLRQCLPLGVKQT